jgi:hypothetical protein
MEEQQNDITINYQVHLFFGGFLLIIERDVECRRVGIVCLSMVHMKKYRVQPQTSDDIRLQFGWKVHSV